MPSLSKLHGMNHQSLKCQRFMLLFLLSISVITPILFLSDKLSRITTSVGFVPKEFLQDIPSIKYATDIQLNAIQQEEGEDVKEPARIVYKDGDYDSVISDNSSDSNVAPKENRNEGKGNKLSESGFDASEGSRFRVGVGRENQQKIVLPTRDGKRQELSIWRTGLQPNGRSQTRKVTDEKVREMKDQIIRAKAYLNFAPPSSNSHLVKELKLRIRELERGVGEATKDSDLSRSALQRTRAMEAALSKASHIYTDCSAREKKLRAMAYNAEEQVRAHRNQASFLTHLAATTFPKGLHCFSMRLTADYLSLQPEERELPNKQKLWQVDLYHYALFSDNVLACAVVVNSTVSTSSEPEKIVFHVVTDALNLPAMSMWFLANPSGQAVIHVESFDDLKWSSSSFSPVLKQPGHHNSRYTLPLNHLRFYLPELFPALEKLVLLDHDVVVQRDLRDLWSIDMKGKVNGAVETCRDSKFPLQMDMFLNFSDPAVARRFDPKACVWAFGMNMFDLREWRRQDLMTVYHKWLELGKKRQLWKSGSLPLGLVTFYSRTKTLDRRWHILGLGHDSGVGRGDIERAAVIHYDGNMKPWLEIGIGKFRGYWSKFVNYDHPYLQQCNIHP